MIKVNLPFDNPAGFDQSTIPEELKLLKLKIDSGEKPIFKETLWGRYKLFLWEKQGQKCCFCERKISALGEGDVEHYRPKGNAKDITNRKIRSQNGYWWLAYEWTNFVFCCRTCNIQKTNRFPLINEDDRITLPGIANYDINGRYGLESPALINPRFDDVEEFFIYDTSKAHNLGRVFIAPVSDDANRKRKAEETIEIVDLNRISRVNTKATKDTLVDDRASVFVRLLKDLDRLKLLEDGLALARGNYARNSEPSLPDIINGLSEEMQQQKTNVLTYSKHDAAFSGMCRYFLKSINRTDLIHPT